MAIRSDYLEGFLFKIYSQFFQVEWYIVFYVMFNVSEILIFLLSLSLTQGI